MEIPWTPKQGHASCSEELHTFQEENILMEIEQIRMDFKGPYNQTFPP